MDVVNHCLAEVTEWKPSTEQERKIKAQETVTLEEFKALITAKSCMENEFRIEANPRLAENKQYAWEHYSKLERQKLLNMMGRLDALVATASLSR